MGIIRKVKVLAEANLAQEINSNKKNFLGISAIKEMLGKMLSPLRRNMGHLVTQEMEKAQEPNNSTFPQSSPASFPATQPKLKKVKAWIGRIKSHPLEEKTRSENVKETQGCTWSMGPDKIHPQVLRESVDEATEPPSIIFENIEVY